MEKEQVIKEILSTEQKYVKDLETVLVVYKEPLSKANDIISITTVNQIFKNLNVILNINKNLLKQFTDYYDDFVKLNGFYSGGISAGKIFLKLAPFLKTYTDYCNNYENVATTIRNERKTNKKFDEFLAKLERNHKQSQGLGLTSYLITPVQRIPRYSLLLRELIKVSDPSMDDYENLELAIEKVKESSEYINSKLKIMDNQKKLLGVQKRIEAGLMKEEEFLLEGQTGSAVGTPKTGPIPKHRSSTPDTTSPQGSNLKKDDKKKKGQGLTSLFSKFKRGSKTTGGEVGNRGSKSGPTTPGQVSPTAEEEEESELEPGMNIIQPHRLYVSEGKITVFQNENEMALIGDELQKLEKVVFIFSDIMLFCTEGKLPNSIIYVSETEYIPSSGNIDTIPWVKDLKGDLFQYVGLQETLTFRAKDEDDKKKWIENLEKTIDIAIKKKVDDVDLESLVKAQVGYTPSESYHNFEPETPREKRNPETVQQEVVEETVKQVGEEDVKQDTNLVVEEEIVKQDVEESKEESVVVEEETVESSSEDLLLKEEKLKEELEKKRLEKEKKKEEEERIQKEEEKKRQEEEKEKIQQEEEEEKRKEKERIQQEEKKQQEEKERIEQERLQQEEKEEKKKQEEKERIQKEEEKKRQEEEEKKQKEEEEEKQQEETQPNEEKEKRKRNGKKRKSETVEENSKSNQPTTIRDLEKKTSLSQIDLLKNKLQTDNKYKGLPTPKPKPKVRSVDDAKLIEEIEKEKNVSLKSVKALDMEQLLNCYKDSQSTISLVAAKAQQKYDNLIIEIKRAQKNRKAKPGSVHVNVDLESSIKEIEEKENLSLSFSRKEDVNKLLNAYRDSKSPVAFVSEKAKQSYEEILEQVKRDNVKAQRQK
eukprot:gene5869-9697_t